MRPDWLKSNAPHIIQRKEARQSQGTSQCETLAQNTRLSDLRLADAKDSKYIVGDPGREWWVGPKILTPRLCSGGEKNLKDSLGVQPSPALRSQNVDLRLHREGIETHMTKEPRDLENHRRQRPQKSTTEVVKRIHGLMAEMMQAREVRMRYLAESFGLDDGYNKKVLDRLLDASEDTGDAAPFKLATDIGWLFRGFLLAQGQAPNKKTWLHATKVLKKAHKEWDYFDQRDYTTFQSLFAVPDEVHAENHRDR